MNMGDLLVGLAKTAAFVIAFAVWMTFGLALWAFRLSRMVIAYSFQAMLVPFTGHDLTKSEQALRTAVGFWLDGAKRLLRIFDSDQPPVAEKVHWSDVLPGVARDALYAAVLGITWLGMHWAYDGMVSPALLPLSASSSQINNPPVVPRPAIPKQLATPGEVSTSVTQHEISGASVPDIRDVDKFDRVTLHQETPVYPREEMRRGVQGTTTVVAWIGLEGNIENASVEVSSGNNHLDDAALTAVRRWRFSPGEKEAIRVPFNFHLE